MELTDKTSNLMLFGALMMARAGKAPIAEAVRAVPATQRTRKLAEVLAKTKHAAGDSDATAAAWKDRVAENAASPSAQPVAPQPDDVYPRLGSQHVSKTGPVNEILTQSVRLHCPVCANEATLELDTWDLEHLHIRGHLERYCHYCGTDSLWEPSDGPERHLTRLFI